MSIRPFSAWTYIRNNRSRSLVLLLMMSFITICFIGGMYVDNPLETFRVSRSESDRYLHIYVNGSSNDAIDEYHRMQTELAEQLPEEAREILYINTRYFNFESIMLFDCQVNGFIFQTPEDFEIFKQRTHLVPEDVVLNDFDVVMSEQLAESEDLTIGDLIGSSQKLKLAQTFKGEGMRVFGVADVGGTNDMLVVSNDGVCDQKLHDDLRRCASELSRKYPHVAFETASTYVQEVEGQMGFMYYIFAVVVILVAIVLLVTINAVFTAAYDKRKHEFAIYKAMGFTKGQIFWKVASEVLLLNLGAFIFGMLVNVGLILVLNQCMWSSGYHFYRVTKSAVLGTVITEVLVILTIILLNWRKVGKYEVTEE